MKQIYDRYITHCQFYYLYNLYICNNIHKISLRSLFSRSSGKNEPEEDERIIASCDLSVIPTGTTVQLERELYKYMLYEDTLCNTFSNENKYNWRKYLCCQPCSRACAEMFWKLAVRCSRWLPCSENKCCAFIDMVISLLILYIVFIMFCFVLTELLLKQMFTRRPVTNLNYT